MLEDVLTVDCVKILSRLVVQFFCLLSLPVSTPRLLGTL